MTDQLLSAKLNKIQTIKLAWHQVMENGIAITAAHKLHVLPLSRMICDRLFTRKLQKNSLINIFTFRIIEPTPFVEIPNGTKDVMHHNNEVLIRATLVVMIDAHFRIEHRSIVLVYPASQIGVFCVEKNILVK